MCQRCCDHTVIHLVIITGLINSPGKGVATGRGQTHSLVVNLATPGELQQWTYVLLVAQISSGTDKITFWWPLGIQPLISRYFRSIVLSTPTPFCRFPLPHLWPTGHFKGQQCPPFAGRIYKRTICSCFSHEGRWGEWICMSTALTLARNVVRFQLHVPTAFFAVRYHMVKFE